MAISVLCSIGRPWSPFRCVRCSIITEACFWILTRISWSIPIGCRVSTDKEDQASSLASRQREQPGYDTASLKADVNAHIKGLMGREVDELFQKAILDNMIVYPGHRLEVRRNLLPAKWRFVLDSMASIRRSGGCHYDPSVPISVSKPFSSSKGIA